MRPSRSSDHKVLVQEDFSRPLRAGRNSPTRRAAAGAVSSSRWTKPFIRGAPLWVGIAVSLLAVVLLIGMLPDKPDKTVTIVAGNPSFGIVTATPEQASEFSGPGCQNSYDQACGEFIPDPQPDENQPIAITIAVTPAKPKVGEVVTFAVEANDPDAQIDRDCVGGNYGDQFSDPKTCSAPVCLAQYGKWSPPPKRPDQVQFTFQHIYSSPGKYEVSYPFVSYRGCGNPFYSQSEGRQTVMVR